MKIHLNDDINPHLMKAARVHVGRLGINLFMKFRIVPQTRVRRISEKRSPRNIVNQLMSYQEEYKKTGKIPRGLDELQMFWFIQTDIVWRVSFHRLKPTISAFSEDPFGSWPSSIPKPYIEGEIENKVTRSWRPPRQLRPNPQVGNSGVLGISNTITTNIWERLFYNEVNQNTL